MEKIKFDNYIENFNEYDLNKLIEREYVSITEKEQRIDRLISTITLKYNDELDKFIDLFEANNPIVNEVSIKVEIVSAYTALDFDAESIEEVVKVYDTLSEKRIINQLIAHIDDAKVFMNFFYNKLNAHREFKEKEYFTQNINVVSCVDNLIPYVANLIEVLTNKVEGLDVEKLNKKLENLDIEKYTTDYLKKLTKVK